MPNNFDNPRVVPVATIKLAPGEVAFYDPITKIYLTMDHPTEKIYNYMETAQLKKSIKSKKIILIDGFLNFDRVPPKKQNDIELKMENSTDASEETVEDIHIEAKEKIEIETSKKKNNPEEGVKKETKKAKKVSKTNSKASK